MSFQIFLNALSTLAQIPSQEDKATFFRNEIFTYWTLRQDVKAFCIGQASEIDGQIKVITPQEFNIFYYALRTSYPYTVSILNNIMSETSNIEILKILREEIITKFYDGVQWHSSDVEKTYTGLNSRIVSCTRSCEYLSFFLPAPDTLRDKELLILSAFEYTLMYKLFNIEDIGIRTVERTNNFYRCTINFATYTNYWLQYVQVPVQAENDPHEKLRNNKKILTVLPKIEELDLQSTALKIKLTKFELSQLLQATETTPLAVHAIDFHVTDLRPYEITVNPNIYAAWVTAQESKLINKLGIFAASSLIPHARSDSPQLEVKLPRV